MCSFEVCKSLTAILTLLGDVGLRTGPTRGLSVDGNISRKEERKKGPVLPSESLHEGSCAPFLVSSVVDEETMGQVVDIPWFGSVLWVHFSA